MDHSLNLSEIIKNIPVMNIPVSDTEIELRVFFNAGCCKEVLSQYEQSRNFRTSFAKAVFHMYRQTTQNYEKMLTENDFAELNDNILGRILNKILEQDSHMKQAYDEIQEQNMYKRFYKADVAVLKSASAKIFSELKGIYEKTQFLNNALEDMPIDPRALMEEADPFREALSSVIDPITQAAEDIQREFKGYMSLEEKKLIADAGRELQTFVSSVNRALLYRGKWSAGRKALADLGWCYSTELPKEIAEKVAAEKDTMDRETADKLITEYFRKNRCEAMKSIVCSWTGLPYFEQRAGIFHEALVSHSRKYYNTPVALLTIHTEGVITDFMRTSLRNQAEGEKESLSFCAFEILHNIMKKLETAFNEQFRSFALGSADGKSQNDIAHGQAFEPETEANSLKQFLYLNELYYQFLYLNDPVQETLF